MQSHDPPADISSTEFAIHSSTSMAPARSCYIERLGSKTIYSKGQLSDASFQFPFCLRGSLCCEDVPKGEPSLPRRFPSSPKSQEQCTSKLNSAIFSCFSEQAFIPLSSRRFRVYHTWFSYAKVLTIHQIVDFVDSHEQGHKRPSKTSLQSTHFAMRLLFKPKPLLEYLGSRDCTLIRSTRGFFCEDDPKRRMVFTIWRNSVRIIINYGVQLL